MKEVNHSMDSRHEITQRSASTKDNKMQVALFRSKKPKNIITQAQSDKELLSFKIK